MSTLWMQELLWEKNGDPVLNDDGTQATMFDLVAAMGAAYRRHGLEFNFATASMSNGTLHDLASYVHRKMQEHNAT